MPRKVRELTNEGIYHVFNRGNNRRDLFVHSDDFNIFKDLLLQQKLKYEFSLYHYCLMTNHFHFLLKVRQGNDLPQLMHRLQLAYTRYIKQKYGFIGHLFQERFRSPRIAKESYYLQCGRYIERNPVKAGMVSQASDYAYSSAGYYAIGSKDLLLTPNEYYLDMGTTDQERQFRYRRFLMLEEPYEPMIDKALIQV